MPNTFSSQDPLLDEAIASAYSDLNQFSASEEGYQKALDQLSKLYKLKNDAAEIELKFIDNSAKSEMEQQKIDLEFDASQLPFYKRVDPNTLILAAGNIFIGLRVLKYEETGVVTSKWASFMMKKF